MNRTILLFLFLLISAWIHGQEIMDIGIYNRSIKMTNDGWELVNAGNYEEAKDLFESAIQINSGNADSYVGAATCYMKLEQFELANERVDSALAMTKGQSDIHYLAGNINFKSGNFNQAVTYYSQAITLNKQSEIKIDIYNCYFNRANSFLSLKNYTEALSDLNIVLSVRSDFTDAYYNRAITLKNLSRSEEACRDFHIAMQLGSSKAQIHLDSYCQNIEYTKLNISDLKSEMPIESNLHEDQLMTRDYSDTVLLDTLYYHGSWELCSGNDFLSYRIAKINTGKLIFVDNFVDYYQDGSIMAKGVYDKKGVKNGKFERFYTNGQLYSSGNFLDNKQFGIWKYYYPDGSLSEIIDFTEDDYYVVESYNENGKKGVSQGTGTWKKLLATNNYQNPKLIGKFDNKLKKGTWKVVTTNGTVLHKEEYKNGEFQAAKSYNTPGIAEKSNQIFDKSYFYPQSFTVAEEFKIAHDASYHYYPYLTVLKPIKFNSDENIKKANFPGGMHDFYMFIQKNLRYPAEARRRQITGDVWLKITIKKDGSIGDIDLVKEADDTLAEEAIRVIRLSPRWNPAINNGIPVDDTLIMPITFKLG